MDGHSEFVLEEHSLSSVAARAVGAFALPVGVLLASSLLLGYARELPDFLYALRVYGPYFTLGVGLLISLAFKRGRSLFAVLSLLLAYCGFRLFVADGVQDFVGKTVYGALCIFVPLNLAFLAVMRERGALNPYGARRFALFMIEIGVVAAVVFGGYEAITDWLYQPLYGTVLIDSPIPQLGLTTMALALAVTIVRAAIRAAVTEASLAVAIAAFAAACNGVATSEVFAWFTTAGVILTAAVVQDSHRMAFRDELTGLPSRRALTESLMGLERNYTIAMLDVDHFKSFNDKWGHDIGDQVLRLVASRIQRVGGGGRAYRYGGEEFTIVFPGKRLLEVLSRLDAMRKDIAAYRLRIRDKSRPRRPDAQSPKGYVDEASNWISVTISAGIAEKKDRLATPEEVVKAADEALYRAKAAGRNQVSR